jgi:hypothetical protein
VIEPDGSRIIAVAFLVSLPSLVSRGDQAVQPLLVKANGGWCWFQGERAIVADGKVVFTSISGHTSPDWDAGDLVATAYDVATGSIEHFKLHAKLQSDDHDVAGLSVLPDGRILAVYGRHGSDPLQRWRITLRPADISQWTPESSFDVGRAYTYSNVYRLTGEQDRIYNFHRGLGFNPNCTISEDGGLSWRYGWRLAEWTRQDFLGDPRFTGLDGGRPYVRYASNGRDTIHFLLTDDHPRAYDNGVYHGYYRSGRLYRSEGTELASPAAIDYLPPQPRDFTEVFAGGTERVAWCVDLRLDALDQPYVAFSVQLDGASSRDKRAPGPLHHRYDYGRFHQGRWHVHPLAHAGTQLYRGEDDYTGLVALDPHDPSTVVISTNADPVSGQALISNRDGASHWELFLGRTFDDGQHWQWQALTSHSAVDQLRPLIPPWPGGPRVILWTRGKLDSYQSFQLDIVALVQPRSGLEPN